MSIQSDFGRTERERGKRRGLGLGREFLTSSGRQRPRWTIHFPDALFAILSQTPFPRPRNASSSATETSYLFFTHHFHGFQTPSQTHCYHAASQVKHLLPRHHLRLPFKSQLQKSSNLPQNLRLTLYYQFQCPQARSFFSSHLYTYICVNVCGRSRLILFHWFFLFGFSLVVEVYSENPEDPSTFRSRLSILKKKLEVVGFDAETLKPGQYSHLTCPKVHVS